MNARTSARAAGWFGAGSGFVALAALFLVVPPLRAADAPASDPAADPYATLHYYYPVPKADPAQTIRADLCAYGGTPGGITAAIQATRMGKTAVLVEFGRHLGGMTASGLSATDGGRTAGGISVEFYNVVGKSGFKPAAAEAQFKAMLEKAGVRVFYEHRLASVAKDGATITQIAAENGNVFKAKMFVDATYEGDLMALAKVSYATGREGNALYGETPSGVQRPGAHNFRFPVDPYVKPGDEKSGVVPGVSNTAADAPGKVGQPDDRIRAYNFRMYLAKMPGTLPFPKPPGYDPSRYEVLARYIEAGGEQIKFTDFMQLHAGDSNNNGGFSTDHIGMNYGWPDGAYEQREKIYQDHVNYQQGMMYFLANDPRVPEKIRAAVAGFGLAPGNFPETGGWPHQMYVREARRLVGQYVMTEANCRGRTVAEDSVGLGEYNMDSHNVQRFIARAGGRAVVKNEGDVQVGVPHPYPISYRSLAPKEQECGNLLVPVCVASTHISYGSIRMEPVFMVLGQSAATAACQAIDAGVTVQKVDYAKLRERLVADGQNLDYKAPAGGAPRAEAGGVRSADLPGVVVDNAKAKLTGDWPASHIVGGVDGDYLHDGDAGKGEKSARFEVPVPREGRYEVRVSYTPNANRAGNVPVKIEHADGAATAEVDQTLPPPIDRLFVSVGTFRFTPDKPAVVIISNEKTKGHVIVDAVQLLPAK